MVVREENGGNESLDRSDQDTVITHWQGGGDQTVKSKFRLSKLAVRNLSQCSQHLVHHFIYDSKIVMPLIQS